MNKSMIAKLAEALDSAGYEISSLKEISDDDPGFSRFPQMIKLGTTSLFPSISSQIAGESVIKLVSALASVGYDVIHLSFLNREAEIAVYLHEPKN